MAIFRLKKGRFPYLIYAPGLILIMILVGCFGHKKHISVEAERTALPVNVILLIGDGMGLSQISMLHQEKDNTSAFSRFTDIGLINCSPKTEKITDSAAGATAFASGIKTYNGAIGVNELAVPVKSFFELLSERGYSTGLVSTSSITHATPAAFYAHTKNRKYEDDIAAQLLNSSVDFFAGGGRSFFRPLFSKPEASNWIFDTSSYFQFPLDMEAQGKYGFILADEGMPKMSEGRGSFCSDATRIAIDHLKQNKGGFALMIEGSQIDWAGHDKDYDYVRREMEDFNNVVNLVMDYAEKAGNTLVIVTGDHETGGLALAVGKKTNSKGNIKNDYSKVIGTFATNSHTATLIPVFVYGPGSEAFKGIYQNTGIYDRIVQLNN